MFDFLVHQYIASFLYSMVHDIKATNRKSKADKKSATCRTDAQNSYWTSDRPPMIVCCVYVKDNDKRLVSF